MLAASPILRRATYGLTAGLFGTGLWWSSNRKPEDEGEARKRDLAIQLPQRSQTLSSLKSGQVFDVLVVGGGATGTGVALVRGGIEMAAVEKCPSLHRRNPPSWASHGYLTICAVHRAVFQAIPSPLVRTVSIDGLKS